MGMSIAVVGAGISGLVFAREISKYSDMELKIFEKANRPGGRSCSRELRPGVLIDLGAQFFTLRTLYMESFLEPFIRSGLVEKWNPRIMKWSSKEPMMRLQKSTVDRFVASPSMGHFASALEHSLNIQYRTEIGSVRNGTEKRWSLLDIHNQILGEFDCVVFTSPPEQTERLLRSLPTLVNRHVYQKMSPCIAVGVELLNGIEILKHLDAIYFEDHPIFSWISKDSSKPNRDKSSQRWVLHASTSWSEENVDLDREEAGSMLFQSFQELILKSKLDVASVHLSTHRWRYAKPKTLDTQKYRFYDDLGLAFCGDSFSGPRFEGAVISGASLAHRVLRTLDMQKKIN